MLGLQEGGVLKRRHSNSVSYPVLFRAHAARQSDMELWTEREHVDPQGPIELSQEVKSRSRPSLAFMSLRKFRLSQCSACLFRSFSLTSADGSWGNCDVCQMS